MQNSPCELQSSCCALACNCNWTMINLYLSMFSFNRKISISLIRILNKLTYSIIKASHNWTFKGRFSQKEINKQKNLLNLCCFVFESCEISKKKNINLICFCEHFKGEAYKPSKKENYHVFSSYSPYLHLS